MFLEITGFFLAGCAILLTTIEEKKISHFFWHIRHLLPSASNRLKLLQRSLAEIDTISAHAILLILQAREGTRELSKKRLDQANRISEKINEGKVQNIVRDNLNFGSSLEIRYRLKNEPKRILFPFLFVAKLHSQSVAYLEQERELDILVKNLLKCRKKARDQTCQAAIGKYYQEKLEQYIQEYSIFIEENLMRVQMKLRQPLVSEHDDTATMA